MKRQNFPNKTSNNIELTTYGQTSNKVKDVRADRLEKRSERVKKAIAIINDLRNSKKQNEIRQLEYKASRAARKQKHQLLGEAVDRSRCDRSG